MPQTATILTPSLAVQPQAAADAAGSRAGSFPGPVPAAARQWLGLAVGSLLVAGLLSLAVVVGRLPVLARIIDDPLFFKRCLVVHVNLALVVWFYAFISVLAALRAPARTGAAGSALFGAAVAGVVAMLAGGLVRGAAPVLSNYIPVIDHPVYLAGLGLFFAGVTGFMAGRVGPSPVRPAAGLPLDAAAGVQVAIVALVLAASTWASATASLPAGLDRTTHFEFAHWGAGHVLQVANVCAMLAVWLWLLARITGRPVLPVPAARWLFSLLLAPHFIMPLLSWRGALHRDYLEGSTLLMRWGIFPVVLVALFLGLRHLRRQAEPVRSPVARMALTGFTASVGLTLMGFVLGAFIRGSTTLVPAHYHASLGGVTVAFMAAAHLLVEALSGDDVSLCFPARYWHSARRQLACFGIGQAVFALGFAIGGVAGLGRKTYAADQQVRSLGEQAGLAVMGLGGLLAAAAGLWFLVLILRALRHRVAGILPPAPTPASP